MTQSDGSKPREWWIENTGSEMGEFFDSSFEGLDYDSLIHVVEYGAYEAAIRGINLQQDQILSLEEEVACLRSVLSEWNGGVDLTQFTQWIRANELAEERLKK